MTHFRSKRNKKCRCYKVAFYQLLSYIKINSENIKTRSNCALYVNDFLICCKSKHMHTIECQFQFCLDRLDRWITENGFKFSKDKTKCIYFCQIRKIHNEHTLELGQILWSKNTNIWASILNKKLSFIPHIKHVRAKCNKVTQLLRVVAHKKTLPIIGTVKAGLCLLHL